MILCSSWLLYFLHKYMIINISVDINDLYVEEWESLTETVTTEITRTISQEVRNLARKQIDEQIIKPILKELTLKKLWDMVSLLITEDSLIPAQSSRGVNRREDGTISIWDYIDHLLRNVNASDMIKRNIEDIAKKYAEDAKKRLDLYFAAQLVVRMHEKWLIAEDVIKAIQNK